MDELRTLIQTLAEEDMILIESVNMSETGGTIKVVCDKEAGINSQALVAFSKKIMLSELYDTKFAVDYKLEVSSPGIDALLTKPYHFKRNIDREMEITHHDNECESPLKGILLDFSETELTLESGKGKKKKTYKLSLDKIDSGKIILKW